mmetsp:Transcript_28291/g.43524  ORF Transcript_28291/g.43524 Transcript_28291/m.43524 type:complete len:222 (+) Transcript_28291:1213-1878(+)
MCDGSSFSFSAMDSGRTFAKRTSVAVFSTSICVIFLVSVRSFAKMTKTSSPFGPFNPEMDIATGNSEPSLCFASISVRSVNGIPTFRCWLSSCLNHSECSVGKSQSMLHLHKFSRDIPNLVTAASLTCLIHLSRSTTKRASQDASIILSMNPCRRINSISNSFCCVSDRRNPTKRRSSSLSVTISFMFSSTTNSEPSFLRAFISVFFPISLPFPVCMYFFK